MNGRPANRVHAWLIVVAALCAMPQITAASALDRFKSFLSSTQAARSSFEQKVFDRNKRLVQESRGTLTFSRPGKFRWVYEKPYSQTIVGDGVRVWVYDEELKQVTVRRIDQALTSTPAALLAGNNDVMRSFQLSDEGARDGLEWLNAIPKQKEGGFERIRIGFSAAGPEVMELSDGFGQLTLLKFNRFERNPPLDPALFRFSPPKGVDVLGDTK
ncbi:MAG: outer membrane lipoprotein carrier protein LolA [Betaproteobacteria bacterium RIFCSPLOWO2_12_FULL_62_13b]|nr:MAG: outer membrane lipoprotein carrier protein LolA [Betaproteobacteria bacterium RIFCSPLOWO2_12_FULL_62_13b]